MAFNTLEYLEVGKIDFVYDLTPYDYKKLIENVRKSERRVNIINGFIDKLRDDKAHFCFEIIYDIAEFKDDAQYILERYYHLNDFSKEFLEVFFTNSSLGPEYLLQNLDEITELFSDDLNWLFNILFSNLDKNYEVLNFFAFHTNLHIRYSFMKYLIENKSKYIKCFYDDITKYLTSETFQVGEQLSLFKDNMDMREVCELAYLFFEQNIDYKLWQKFKNFILENYSNNELAYRLLSPKKEYLSECSYRIVTNKKGLNEFNLDADQLFITAANYRVNILTNSASQVSQELLDAYKQKIAYFFREGQLDDNYKKIDYYGLGRKLDSFVDKYLSLSKDHSHTFLEEGSTSSCYRIGDYVFKLVRTKWSYEQVICPNLYLIIPNLEEDFIRDRDGIVLAGIEVQKYLKGSAKGIPLKIFSNFKDELKRLGYYTTDSLIGGTLGDNCKLLDDYTESGNPNPPIWFQEYPLVLIDRDRVYSIGTRFPKQLRGDY